MTPQEIAEADANDPLAFARARFSLPEGMIYLDGNSLGRPPGRRRLPHSSAWRGGSGAGALIGGWNTHAWISAPQRVGALIAPLIGAAPNEVIACDSTSVNLYKAAAAALDSAPRAGGDLGGCRRIPHRPLYAAGPGRADRRLLPRPAAERLGSGAGRAHGAVLPQRRPLPDRAVA